MLRRRALVPGRWQASVEYLEEFVRNMLSENVGPEGLKYVPFVFSLFIFVLACNLLGMVPFVHSFTPTSHIAVTFGLAMIVFILAPVLGAISDQASRPELARTERYRPSLLP